MLCVTGLPLRALADTPMHPAAPAQTAAGADIHAGAHASHAVAKNVANPCPDQSRHDDCCPDTTCGCALHVFTMVPPPALGLPDDSGSFKPGLIALPAIPAVTTPIYRPPRA